MLFYCFCTSAPLVILLYIMLELLSNRLTGLQSWHLPHPTFSEKNISTPPPLPQFSFNFHFVRKVKFRICTSLPQFSAN